MDTLYNKAIKHGASDFGMSNNMNKRYYVIIMNVKYLTFPWQVL